MRLSHLLLCFHLLLIHSLVPAQPGVSVPWDFNNDGRFNSLDASSYLSAYSEGPCDGCDPLLDPPFDPDSLDAALRTINSLPPGAADAAGWLPVVVPPDYPQVFFSGRPLAADAIPDGRTISTAFRDPTVAGIFSVVGNPPVEDVIADNVRIPAVLWFERGYTYGPLSIEFGGDSPSRPLIISSFGDPALPPPTFTGPVRLAAGCRGSVHLHDLLVTAGPAGNPATGLEFLGGQSHVLVSGVTIVGFRNNLSFSDLTDAVFHRLTILDSWAPKLPTGELSGHSQGSGASNAHRILFSETAFDGNGWALDPSRATAMNHSAYIQPTCTAISYVRCLVSRSSNTGIQGRGSISVRDSYFYENPAHLTFGHAQTDPSLLPHSRAHNNYFFNSVRSLGWHAGSFLGLNVLASGTFTDSHVLTSPGSLTPRFRLEPFPPSWPGLPTSFSVTRTYAYPTLPTADLFRPLAPSESIAPPLLDERLAPLLTIPWPAHLAAVRSRHKFHWHPTIPVAP